ncbi:MAG: Ig-like domain-containing protein [Candidatus Helarchaeota archaeon]
MTESADPLEFGNTETITITGVTDTSGIQTVLIEFEGDNHTMTDLGSGTWRYSTWTPGSEGTYPYTIYLQDTAGNWNSTNGLIEVKKTTSIPGFQFPLLLSGILIFSIFLLWKRRLKF